MKTADVQVGDWVKPKKWIGQVTALATYSKFGIPGYLVELPPNGRRELVSAGAMEFWFRPGEGERRI